MNTHAYWLDKEYDSALALVGVSGRFPGARDVETFWQNLSQGVTSIRFFTDEELLANGVDPALLAQPNFVKAGSLLDDIDRFDATFFGYTPREAELMDPQQRLFLECVWEALEGAGYSPEANQAITGIFAGSSFCSYLVRNLYADPDFMEQVGVMQASIGNERDALVSNVAYKLNLRGPCMAVQTFCSTSLVAVHMACQSLLNYECDMAVAGGVAIEIPHTGGYLYTEGGIVSPDGVCRTFDAEAHGSVMGNGVGVVLLKRFSDALEDGDHIYALIRGSATNNDGSQRVSVTAPGLEGQTAVIAEAIGNAGVDVESISYVEAHGTATEMGDAVELAAMMKAFATKTERKQFCAIGSVKPNLGHLDRAAGVTGLIKTALALKHKYLPPSLNFEQPNSELDLANSPFYVNTTGREWPSNGSPRRAGVSSFGLGGSNAHVIMEEPPPLLVGSQARTQQLLVFSAPTESALTQMTANLLHYLQQDEQASLANVAYTLQVGRNVFQHRRMLVSDSRGEAIKSLTQQDAARLVTRQDAVRDRAVTFLFPGVGEQYSGVAQELYAQEKVFRQVFDECNSYLQRNCALDLRQSLFPTESDGQVRQSRQVGGTDLRALLGRGASRVGQAEEHRQTRISQPAIFVLELALARQLMAWGIQPQACLGYSVGEYVAACLAGVMTQEDALMLVAERARLIQAFQVGAMVTVALAEQDVQPYLDGQISLAVINGPRTCVLSGPVEAIRQLEQLWQQRDIVYRRIETTHAFHAAMLEPLSAQVTALVRKVSLHAPQIPYVSNLTGTWVTDAQATDPTYWAQHMCQTVRFADGIETILQQRETAIIEVGPGQSLCSFVKQHPACERTRMPLVFSTLPSAHEQRSDQASLLQAVGKLWLSGVTIDWDAFAADEPRQRVPLPTYPFERERYWRDAPTINPAAQRQVNGEQAGPNDDLPFLSDIKDWFSVPSWKQVPALASYTVPPTAQPQTWLVLRGEDSLTGSLVERLRQSGQRVITVEASGQFQTYGTERYGIRPDNRSDYEALLTTLKQQNIQPTQVVHGWTLGVPASLDRLLEIGYYSLIALAQALNDQDSEHCAISILTDDLYDVTGLEHLQAAKAILIGPCRVIPQEYASLSCRNIDVSLSEPGAGQQLYAELSTHADDAVVALRAGRRWLQTFEPVALAPWERDSQQLLRTGGVYLFTGGLGGIALALAEDLVRQVQAKLVLLSRKPVPARSTWEEIIAAQGDQEGLGQQLRKVLALEALGAEVLLLQADCTHEEQMLAAVTQAHELFGTIHGVIHAAAVPGVGLIQLKTRAQSEKVMAAKIQGTLLLERLFETQPLDFLVLFSSMTSVTGGGPGQVDYCAGNAFLDLYALQSHSHARQTVAIDWGEWQWNVWTQGLAGYDIEAQTYFRAHRQQYGISFADGAEALRRILATRLSQVVVSTQDFREVAARSKNFTAAAILEHTQQIRQGQATHPRPELMNPYAVPGSELERKIAGIWEALLGITPVGLDDNFFELGGNSLTGIDLIARIKKSCDAKNLASHVLYEAPTVGALARYIEQGGSQAVVVEEWQGRSEKRRAGLKNRVRESGTVL